LLAHGRWFSPGTPASSTTKTGRPDIAESGTNYQKSNHVGTLRKYLICLQMSTQRREPVGIAVVSEINGTAVNSRVFAFPFIVSTQECKLNGTAVNSFTLKQLTTARCNQKRSIIIF
jgi:hypothetical protein